MDTRSSGGSSFTATQLPETDPADQVHPSQQAQAASSSQGGDNGSDTRPPNLPAIPVFPGSTEVDWMSSQLGLLSRGHFSHVLLIISPIIHHLQYKILFPIIHHFTNSQLYTHYPIII